MSLFTIKIAEIPIQIACRHPQLQQSYAAFLTDTPPLCMVSVSDEELEGEWRSHHFHKLIDKTTGQIIDLDKECSDPTVVAEKKLIRQGDEENLLYRKICRLLPGYDAFILHGSAVALDGKGYVFSGRSGVGKSTHSRLWLEKFGDLDKKEPGARARIINGDKPILALRDGQWLVCGSPWQGKENWGNAASAPLRGICLLERGEKNAVVPTARVTDWLFNSVIMPQEQNDMIAFFDLLDNLVEQVPFYRMQVNNLAADAVAVSHAAMCL